MRLLTRGVSSSEIHSKGLCDPNFLFNFGVTSGQDHNKGSGVLYEVSFAFTWARQLEPRFGGVHFHTAAGVFAFVSSPKYTVFLMGYRRGTFASPHSAGIVFQGCNRKSAGRRLYNITNVLCAPELYT